MAKLVRFYHSVKPTSLGLPQGTVNGSIFRRVRCDAPRAFCLTLDETRWPFRRPFELRMHANRTIASALATSFVVGSFTADDLVKRGSALLGKRRKWLPPLAERLIASFSTGARPGKWEVEAFLLDDRGFQKACQRSELTIVDRLDPTPGAMSPAVPAQFWESVPAITSPKELADWLQVPLRQLNWFANPPYRGRSVAEGKLAHYRYRRLTKPDGQFRLIEAPKPRLKGMQRKILAEILNLVPPHAACHGFRPGRSITTFAQPHVGQEVVIKLDLRDFFPSIQVAPIAALFRFLGYPEIVANLLAGLCTTSAPEELWNDEAPRPSSSLARAQIRMYCEPHLPQGAPTSPALANLCAFRLDYRLNGLAQALDATYTRYADDLAFSGGGQLKRSARRFAIHASVIAQQEGFAVHPRKTRVMGQGVRQRIAGVVVNQTTSIPRADFDRLKATLTNCLRHGPASQNRNGHANFRSYLAGKISFVAMVNPRRAGQLQALFDRIAW